MAKLYRKIPLRVCVGVRMTEVCTTVAHPSGVGIRLGYIQYSQAVLVAA